MEQLVGVFIIGHEKTKKITNREGFEYDYTTFNVLGKTSDILEREADMIIYGDMVVEKAEDGSAITNRKLKFRSDGNILCGTRFRNFPSEIENDASVFVETFKNAVLGLYENDESAVEEAKKEQENKNDKKAEKVIEKEKESITIESVKNEIGEALKPMEKAQKVKCAKYFKESLGETDYRKSEDLKALQQALDFVNSL